MLMAESGCRKLRTGHIPWTPELSQALKDKRYVTLTLRKTSGKYVARSSLQRARDQASAEIVSMVRNGQIPKALHTVRHLISKLRKSTKESNKLSSQTKSKKVFSILRQVLKPAKRAVTSLAVEDADGTVTEAFNKKDVESIALAEGETVNGF